MDGVDASIIQSDGETKYNVIIDKYFKYSQSIFRDLTRIRDKIKKSKDLKKFSGEIKNIEKKITLFHAEAVNKLLKKSKVNIDFIGFHGQTIYHNEKEKISKQLGDGKLLSKLTKKTVVYNFRQNDLKYGGSGAPLTPIFHRLIIDKCKIKLPVTILNLGGIANITNIKNKKSMDCFNSSDIGPGNCLIDMWIRKNSKKNYDTNGLIAKSGKIEKIILKKTLIQYKKKKLDEQKTTYDIKDFDLSFAHGLSLEDGAATITEYTSNILSDYLPNNVTIIVCGGGRKNKFLIKRIEEKIKTKLKLIDNLGIDGDFIESQAFAYLSIRSYLKLPISFPSTTGVSKPCTGGVIIKN